jgi:hypothetical protein
MEQLMTFDQENFLREMELFKKIPVLENEEFLHQKIIDESEKTKTDLDDLSDSD